MERNTAIANSVYRKVMLRIMPFLVLCYVVAFIDRSNVGFAKLQFMRDLGFNETIYGFGGGIFYLGYVLFEIPSNLYLAKAGVRKTLLRIMVLWGICSTFLSLMTTPAHFYLLRFLLGVGEAGLFPGMILYITFWVPASRRARITAMFMASIPIAGMLGGPLSGWIMHAMAGWWGLKGWQWVFLIEGIPACLLGVAAYLYLDDGPADCKWLTADEKAGISSDLARDESSSHETRHTSFAPALRDPKVYLLAALGFSVMVSTAGIFLWLPTIIRKSGVESVWKIGLLSAIPFLAGFIAQFAVARHSDRTLERRWHAIVSALVGALGWGMLPLVSNSTALSILMLTVATTGTLAAMGPYWTLPATMLSGTAAAGGIALITSLAGIGNFISPILVGWLSTRTGNLAIGQYYFSALLVFGVLMLLLGVKGTPKPLQAAYRQATS
jgi:D-galactonate transporter